MNNKNIFLFYNNQQASSELNDPAFHLAQN
jgi:hypothetical protein